MEGALRAALAGLRRARVQPRGRCGALRGWSGLLLGLLVASAGQAQVPDSLRSDSLRAYRLDPLVVTGTRVPTRAARLPLSVSQVGRAELEATAASNVLPVVAGAVPGVFLQRRGTTGFGVAPGSGGALSIRGFSGAPNTRVLVLIDGQPQFMGLFGHPIADAYGVADVERVEVVRGPASMLYGSNALAGAFHLISRRPTGDGLGGGAQASYGSYGTARLDAHGGYRRGSTAVGGSLRYDRTAGVRVGRDDGFALRSVSARAEHRMAPRAGASLRLLADATLADARFHDPGPTSAASPPPDARRDYLRGRVALGLEHAHARLDGAARFYYSFGDHAFSNGFRSDDLEAGLTLYQNWTPTPATALTLGLDHRTFGGTATVRTPGGRVPLVEGARIGETDVYAVLHQRVGGRLDAMAGLRRITNTRYGPAWVPGAGLAVRVAEALRLRASYGRGIRSPVPLDLFVGPVANASLGPERLASYEVGAQVRARRARIVVDAAVFRMIGADLIEVVGGPGGPARRQNAGRTVHRGLELRADARAAPGLSVFARYAYLDTERRVALAPRHDLHTGLWARLDRVDLRLGVQWVAGLVPDPARRDTERYVLVQTYGAVRLRPALRLFAEADNLLGQAYQIDAGYPMPGRTVAVGLRLARP